MRMQVLHRTIWLLTWQKRKNTSFFSKFTENTQINNATYSIIVEEFQKPLQKLNKSGDSTKNVSNHRDKSWSATKQGLDGSLSFGNFLDAFFQRAKCKMRVFMVWNSPPWMFGVRQRRALESILYHHRHACVVVFSETIELNFFSEFVEHGYKVAVVMPNLDELLKDTPTHIFSSVWQEWKKSKNYPTHYSELIRLAALYKYGGFYLDSDIIVLKPLSELNNTVGLENEPAEKTLNGAVMSFRKHSPFIMECLTEFYSSYDDTLLRWNGADLLTRVAKNFSSSKDIVDRKKELLLQPSFNFFPISESTILRYFSAPATNAQQLEQDALFKKILNESTTVHFWNSVTSSLIPESGSLISRLLNQFCITCSDVL